jgi:hypothetical protein
MKDKENHGLQELIKDLEILVASNDERLQRNLKNSTGDPVFEFYKKGYRGGLTLAMGLAKNYLESDITLL